MKRSCDVDCVVKEVVFCCTNFEDGVWNVEGGAKGDAAEKLSVTLTISGASTERELWPGNTELSTNVCLSFHWIHFPP